MADKVNVAVKVDPGSARPRRSAQPKRRTSYWLVVEAIRLEREGEIERPRADAGSARPLRRVRRVHGLKNAAAAARAAERILQAAATRTP